MASAWLYSYSAANTEPPAAGQLRFNVNAAPYADITTLWVRYISSDGFDLFYALSAIPVGARLFVQDKNDHALAVELRVTAAPIDKGTHIELPVAWVQGGAIALGGGQEVVLVELAGSDVLPPEPPGPAPAGPVTWPAHAYSVLVTAPIEEPITLEEAKLRAGLDWSADPARDQLMRDFIAAARSKVEQDTGLALLLQTRDVYYDGSPLPEPLLLCVGQCRPTEEVVSVSPIEPTTLVVAWPALASGVPVVIRVRAGWPDAAALRTAAPLLVQAVGLLTAHYATAGRDLAAIASMSEVPQGYCDLIQPYIPMLVP